jgi:NAD+ kinase
MNIAIHGKIFSEQTVPAVQQIIDTLSSHDAAIRMSAEFFDISAQYGISLDGVEKYNAREDIEDCRAFISMGGDGTFLESLTHIGPNETPVLGINTGRLGFLATINIDQIDEAVNAIFNGHYGLDSRSLVRCEAENDLFEGTNFGLNEFTVLKQDTSSMINVHTWLNGEFLNSYWADGLIIATPTGSTGYSLSCGGPVVMPHSGNFILTPVSPHNLTVRPLIVSDLSILELKVESRSNFFLVSLDSRSKVVRSSLKLTVKKEDFQARLIKFDGYSFVNTLRKKLNWGFDIRN